VERGYRWQCERESRLVRWARIYDLGDRTQHFSFTGDPLMRLNVIGAAVTLLALCGCTGSTGPDGGTYTATVTGAVDTTFTGRAALERGAGLDEFKYAVHMFLPGRGPEFGIFLFFPERPTVGTYRIVGGGGGSLTSGEVSAVASLGRLFTATYGEVKINSSTPVRGTFEFLRQPPAAGPNPELRVRGEFTLR
jgi:hypothetical protein